jgi:hypothetical protein
MATEATGTFKLEGWDEQAYEERDGGRKLTEAHVKQTFSGDIEGEGEVRWLMAYRPDETADYIGLQRITGSLGGREGSFVLQTYGTFDGKVAAGAWEVLDGSGTGELEGLKGSGSFKAPMGDPPEVTLSYEIG